MVVTPAQVQKVLAGNHTFKQLGFSMLLMRLKTLYSKNHSPSTLQICVDEINAFLKKYEAIMSADYAVFSNI